MSGIFIIFCFFQGKFWGFSS